MSETIDKKNKLHKEAILTVIEAGARGAFDKDWNTEKEMWHIDIREIILVLRKHLKEIDIKWILDDMRYIGQTAMDDTFQMSQVERGELRAHREKQYYYNLTKQL